MLMRIGLGYDAPALVSGRALILGGVTIPYALGLEGHSDADVVVHALCDAMLGALALGDLGQHFPSTDERWRGVSSLRLLRHVAALLTEQQYGLHNADITVVAPAAVGTLYYTDATESECGCGCRTGTDQCESYDDRWVGLYRSGCRNDGVRGVFDPPAGGGTAIMAQLR
jgi:2C-methyl-D-erythritol 2,4-cyclodiphosphate synthase